MTLQSGIVRKLKSDKLDLDTIQGNSDARGELISFTQQPVNQERTQHYAQAVVRFGRGQEAEDVVLTSKTWLRPLKWVIQDLSRT